MKTRLYYLKFMICTMLILSVISMLSLQAQDYLISFTGSGGSATVATVKVENLTMRTSLTMNGSNVLHLLGVVTGIETVKEDEAGKIIFYPNPMKDYLRMKFVLPEPAKTLITLYDLSGSKIVQIQDLLPKGQHTYRIQGVEEGIYLVKISSGRYSFRGRFISSVSQNRNAKIVYENTENITVKPEKQSDSKGTNAETVMQYTTGDRLKLTGISSKYSTVITDVPTSSKIITFNFIACTDGDGNNYPAVKIGTQTWMAENLKTTKLNEETEIPNISDSIQWGNMTASAYCWSRNNISNKDTYGALYNWYTVNTGKLCPNGWHVPTYPEWDTLMTLLGGDSIAGVSLKETGIAHWNIASEATNESGFTALGSSGRSYDGTFGSIGISGFWWSSSEYSLTDALSRNMMSSSNSVGNYYTSEKYGFSVRCLEGQPQKEMSVEEAFPGVHGVHQDFIINQDTLTVEKIKDKYVFQGDIILTEDQLNSVSNKGAGLNSFIKRWDCCVYYKINSNLIYRKGAIMAAIQAWEASTPSLKFIERTTEKNYIEFYWDKDGCASYLGMIGGKQEIWIADWAKTGNIMHEIGHAIGLIHEHSRIDRKNYVYILDQNIDPNAVDNFGKISTTYLSSNFDFNSIMLYDSYAFSKNGLPTILKNDGSTFPSNRKFLSIDDINVVKPMYKNDSVKDIDGNAYRIIKIGNQQWMGANLKTLHYNDGEAIRLVTDPDEWELLRLNDSEDPFYTWYNYAKDTYIKTYGALYNWFAVNTGKLCPIGWHVPDNAEWSTLTGFAGGPEVAGDKLKMTGPLQYLGYGGPLWIPNTGATNEFCFSALPGGLASSLFGPGEDMGGGGYWWSSSEDRAACYAKAVAECPPPHCYPKKAACSWSINFSNFNSVDSSIDYNQCWSALDGLSVRCIKNNTP
jgi:uncharacterized protein (TIGR02145 family)